MLTSANTQEKMSRIKLLDNRLANQIAAGEVVERPSSVVKELMENSIDAGASKIEVEIERGGTRLIRVTDNGKGIHREDLTLSLTRHATSKISSTEDLACIQSLGFRGEALASISAVSKLSLTSRTYDSDLAWQAIAHGRDMTVDVQPAAAAPGTRIEVADLFFNTPARQKFLRAEKTEFNHIEEIFNRHALVNFAIAFILKHNHKIIKRVPACGEKSQYLNRIATICGKAFAENCVPFECQHESIHLFGWLGKPEFHRSESDIQYVYINGRPVKDKTLNHAIRQSYDGLLPPGRMPTYVIFLNMDPTEVDVNVHPTKHEVRFGEQRLVHDLLAKSISESLSDCHRQMDIITDAIIDSSDGDEQECRSEDEYSLNDFLSSSNKYAIDSNRVAPSTNATPNYYSNPSPRTHQIRESFNYSPTFNRSKISSTCNDISSVLDADSKTHHNLIKLDKELWINVVENKVLVIDGQLLLTEFILKILNQPQVIKNKALLFPHSLSINSALLEEEKFHLQLEKLGFISEPIKNQNSDEAQILIKKIPIWLAHFENQWIIQQMQNWFAGDDLNNEIIANKISQSIATITIELMCLLMDEMTNELLSSQSTRELTADHLRQLFL